MPATTVESSMAATITMAVIRIHLRLIMVC
ncbi:Protein of unknown function [Thermobacillus xylanilyticus]|uniref:Uncharacterized protein n=1 Tax=Thermobacillus xylanilyticus TaxID=76633 RepID=A0ABM8V6Z2_THEXY|nr:Protein of unknown function [Thermobacillus xylanilyticus]